MAGATTRGAFPYPSPADPDDVPADIQKLADRMALVVRLVDEPVSVVLTDPAVVGLKVKLAAGQTGNALEVRDSADALLGNITAAGRVSTPFISVSGSGVDKFAIFGADTGQPSNVHITGSVADRRGLTIKLAAGQTASALEVRDSANVDVMRVGNTGRVFAPFFHVGPGGQSYLQGAAGDDTARLIANSAGSIPLVVKGAVAQTNDVVQVRNSADAINAHIRSDGTMAVLLGNPRQTNAGFETHAPATNLEAATFLGKAGQSANLVNFRIIGAAVTASVSATGAGTFKGMQVDEPAGLSASDSGLTVYFTGIGNRRVVVGNNDSGGSGYRILRILN